MLLFLLFSFLLLLLCGYIANIVYHFRIINIFFTLRIVNARDIHHQQTIITYKTYLSHTAQLTYYHTIIITMATKKVNYIFLDTVYTSPQIWTFDFACLWKYTFLSYFNYSRWENRKNGGQTKKGVMTFLSHLIRFALSIQDQFKKNRVPSSF